MTLEFLSVKEAAQLLNVSEKVVRADITRGRLPAYRVGRLVRIRRSDLELLAITPTRSRQ
jgi:excisionase family DNA binding protein